jgi:starch phosphorylase
MRPLGTYRAAPVLPEALLFLNQLAYDLRWSYREELRSLFADLDPVAWERLGRNPVELLRFADPSRLAERAADASYVARVEAARERLEREDSKEPPVAGALLLREAQERIAYFCLEFGISEVLPIYSGGLGVLAGDHLKSAADLRVPLVAVGLFYREGFFTQTFSGDGRQRESYPIQDPEDLPVRLLKPPSGVLPVVHVTLARKQVHVLVREARIGPVRLLLLDTHVPENRPGHREITSRLYGGDMETRIQQEIVLGIGGMRALELAGLRPTVRHANEGHASFLGLEAIRQLRAEHGLSFDEAREVTAAGNVFTTHTPVPAGIDVFPPQLVKKYFEEKIEALGISMERFLGLGRQVPEDPHEYFSAAVLGLRLSGSVNGVSRLHATVSRRLWRGVFPEAPISEIPIEGITNGVHAPTWTDPTIAELDLAHAQGPGERAELWERHEALRLRLVSAARGRTAAARRRRGAPDIEVAGAWELLDEKALTIGFARRFATYKRATLIFFDPERLAKILGDPDRPVQLVFAGKAHPRDDAGKEFLRRVAETSRLPEFAGKVVLLENYDIGLARLLVSGCDVWLNNPRRPHEASGTSGMKAAMNGVVNFSVLDGWWDEAPREETGFVIGDDAERSEEEIAGMLYDTLERDVVPLFYEREKGVPHGWVSKMAASASSLARLFSTDRMVEEYVDRAYLPAARRVRALRAEGFAAARDLARWKSELPRRWTDVNFDSVRTDGADPARLVPGETFPVEVVVRLGGMTAEELSVDWFEGRMERDGGVEQGFSTPLTLVSTDEGRATYTGTIMRPEDDERGYSVRIRPTHPHLKHPNETGLVLWAG